MRKLRLPLTYPPKIEPVLQGTCRQTIRIRNTNKKTGKLVRAKKVGDMIRFFKWSGRPYWSSPVNLTEYTPLTEVIDIRIFQNGWKGKRFHRWDSPLSNLIARWDHVDPPTGETLRDVLISKNGKIPEEGIEAQILRW